MTEYAITFARSARKELAGLESPARDRILGAIEDLGKDPRPHGCRKLRGPAELWRIRVGEYRVVYAIEDAERNIDIVIVRHRRDVYR